MSLVKNVGSKDQVIRIAAGAALIVIALFMLGGLASSLGLVAIIVGSVLMLTAVLNFCPLYRLLGLSTSSQSRLIK